MMGADIDGDVLVYLDMAQVVCPVNMDDTESFYKLLCNFIFY